MTPPRRLIALLAAAVVSYGVAIWAAHVFIGAVYSGALFPELLENRESRTLDYYYSVVDRLVLSGFFLVGIIATALYLVRSRSALAVLAALLVGDIVFCVLSELYGGPLDVRIDGSLPEFFQYFKEAGITLMFVWLFRRTQKWIFVGWACLFGFILLDDALKYHERMGVLLGGFPGVGPVAQFAGVRAVDIGEMLSLVPVLIALTLFLPIPYLRERADIRAAVHRLVGLLIGLIAFGGAMDLIDRMAVSRGSTLTPVLSLAEDGGEMVIVSAIFAYVLVLWRRYGRGALQGKPQALIDEDRLTHVRETN